MSCGELLALQKQAAKVYEKREQDFSQKLAEARKKLANLAQLRLLIFLLAAFLAGYSIYSNRVEFALYALAPFFSISIPLLPMAEKKLLLTCSMVNKIRLQSEKGRKV